MEAFDWDFGNKIISQKVVSEANTWRKNGSQYVKEHEKIVLENGVVSEILYIIVCGHFCPLKDVNE